MISLPELHELVHAWIADVYSRKPHSGIGRETPIHRWERLIVRYPSEPVKPMDPLLHLFTKFRTATVSREGVRFRNLQYQSPELDAERGTAAFVKKSPKHKVLMRWDPADLGNIWVLLPHKGIYLPVPVAPKWAHHAVGRSEYDHDTILAHHRLTNKLSYSVDSVAAAEARLVELAEQALGRKKRRSSASTSRQARRDGVGRTSPAGSDHSTTPTGSVKSRRSAASTPKAANDPPSASPPAVRSATARRAIKTLDLSGTPKP